MPVVLHINRLIFDRKKNKANYQKGDFPRDIKNIKSWTREELENEYITLMKLCKNICNSKMSSDIPQ